MQHGITSTDSRQHARHGLTPAEKDAIVERLAHSVARFREPLRQKDWVPLRKYLYRTNIWIKGSLRTLNDLEKTVNFRTRHVSQLRVIVEKMLNSTIEAERAVFELRVAAVGVKTDGVSGDGVIMDVRIVFNLCDAEWRVDELAVECPPEWAQWNKRPNFRAPIQYDDPLIWDKWE